MMSTEFGITELGGIGNFEVIRNDAVFDAVLVSAGRFGIIYSVVLRAVPQYMLHEQRHFRLWQDVKADVSEIWRDRSTTDNESSNLGRARFLQVAVCLTPHLDFQRNLAGVTEWWDQGMPADPQGRPSRAGGGWNASAKWATSTLAFRRDRSQMPGPLTATPLTL